MSSNRRDLPAPDITTQPFWDAAREGRLLYNKCGGCGVAFAYPRPFCPRCWSSEVTWAEASGKATLYTYSVVHRNDLLPFADLVPYVTAIVDLAEGPRLMTRIVDCALGDVSIGMDLQVVFESLDDAISIPLFRPAVS